jgi:hypothetical protein
MKNNSDAKEGISTKNNVIIHGYFFNSFYIAGVII